MPRFIAFLITVAAILALVLGAVFVFRMPGPSLAPAQATLATSTVQEETSGYVINVAYPQFGIPAADIQIKAIVDRAVTDFKMVPPYNEPGFPKYEFDGSYDSAYIGPDIVSARLILYQDTGGAHGNAIAIGLNFDASSGVPISLDEALALIGKTLPEVADAATKQLTKDFDIVQFPEGATPTLENYQTFLISKNSVTFIFQQYQVEAYAAGMPEISFSRVK
ncbi:DUF3298 domain-containing protein [Candidatus Kaiserbacteria bacterium]|nr:DUF3298 domain-containing protein [Candidatus Kaiserbacteria bacterium]